MEDEGDATWLSRALPVLVGVLIGGLAVYGLADRGIHPTTMEGVAAANFDTSDIVFYPDEGSGDETLGFVMTAAEWFDGSSWHEWSEENCLKPLTEEQPIRLGVVKTEPTDQVAGRWLAVWFECL